TALNAAGEGPFSNELSSTPSAPPGVPALVSATGGDSRVALTWTPPASDGGTPIAAYKVYRGFSPGAETLLASVGNVTAFTDAAALNGTTYFYEVAAVNARGEGPRSTERSATPATVPGAPSLTATARNASVDLAWSAPASSGGAAITEYRVYRGTTPGSETALATLGNVTTYTDATAANRTTYFYEVSAVNAVGEGAV